MYCLHLTLFGEAIKTLSINRLKPNAACLQRSSPSSSPSFGFAVVSYSFNNGNLIPKRSYWWYLRQKANYKQGTYKRVYIYIPSGFIQIEFHRLRVESLSAPLAKVARLISTHCSFTTTSPFPSPPPVPHPISPSTH